MPVYQQLDEIEWVLKRSDALLGPNVNKEKLTRTFKDGKIINQTISVNQAFFQIHREPLSNCVDNVKRSSLHLSETGARSEESPVTKIVITIDKDTGTSSFWNDGMAISCDFDEEKGMYVPQFVFGKLFSGSNFEDEEERLISGRNGVGVKSTNIFSKEFSIEIAGNGVLYKQKWTENMRQVSSPIITQLKKKNRGQGQTYALITFKPDFEKFGIPGYTDEFISYMEKQAIDASMVTGVSVIFNSREYKISSPKEYMELYFPLEGRDFLCLKTSKGNCESEVIVSSSDEPLEIGFVNGISVDVGLHIDNWQEKLFRPIVQKLTKEKLKIKITELKKRTAIFVKCVVVNPVFTSQAKEKLEDPSPPVKVTVDETKEMMKWQLIEDIRESMKNKDISALNKRKKRVVIHELEDANAIQKKDSTLLIVEGNSAKTFVVNGLKFGLLNLKGRSYCGIFTLRGKFLNVRKASDRQLNMNVMTKNIMDAVGLRIGYNYSDDKLFSRLRYRKIVAIADADCFADDDALIIKRNNTISVVAIDSLFDEKVAIDTQLVNDTQVWSDDGWVNILAIRRKTTTKRILTINTYSGLIRCTEDHKLILENGEEIKAGDVKVGDRLYRNRRLVSIPKVSEDMKCKEIRNVMRELQCFNSSKLQNKEDMLNAINNELRFCTHYTPPLPLGGYFNISKEEAWVWGFFFVDGTCGIYTFEKDREKATERNTEKSRNRWKKWVIHHTKRIEELTIKLNEAKKKGEKYGRINERIKDSKKNLERSIKNLTRISNERKSSLTRSGYSYSITNCDCEKLERAYGIMKNKYPEYNWTIIEVTVKDVSSDEVCNNDKVGHHPGVRHRQFRLLLNGGKKVKDFIDTMRSRFYTTKKLKKVPDEILNNTLEVQQSFFDGYYSGDGFRYLEHSKEFNILGQIGCQGLCYLTQQLGYSSSIREDEPNIFRVHLNKSRRKFYPGEVKSIYETNYENKFVYDIETETGKINAGIGEIIMSNCDGIHINGLLLNLVHCLFPSLLNRNFIYFMRTPIVRINSGPTFYIQQLAREYLTEHKEISKKRIKYLKGLGSSNKEEIKDIFGKRIASFEYDEKAGESMELAFGKDADKRKEWLSMFDPNNRVFNGVDVKEGEIEKVTITNFIRNELIDFNIENDKRMIPHIIDGLKESQRKVIYTVFNKKLDFKKQSIKVARLAGFVSASTSYHHGETILYETIKGMAQSFVGSNNIPILLDDGMFGSRVNNDGSAARYIFTKMAALTRFIFREEDDELLDYLEDDGEKIEPEFYVPILPMILINGAISIGSGWSSKVPMFNPMDVLNLVRKIIRNEELEEIHPWYRGFKGTIVKDEEKDNRYIVRGILTKKEDEYRITELSIDDSSDGYKEKVIDPLWSDGYIDNVKFKGDDENIEITFNAGVDPKTKKEFIPDKVNMKLRTYLHTSNMTMFSSEGKIKKYTIKSIIEEFYEVRLKLYEKRKIMTLEKLNHSLTINKNKLKFITEILDGSLTIKNKDENILVQELEEKKYDKIDDGYKYLLDIPVRAMTKKKIEEIISHISEFEAKLEEEANKSPSDKWLEELNNFEKEYIYKN
jgi:DNA gyrase/topoisomerase IV subunit B